MINAIVSSPLIGAHVLLFLKIRPGGREWQLSSQRGPNYRVDKDVKAFKKYVDNLRRKWVTFSGWPAAYTLFDYLSTESANLLYRSGEAIVSSVKEIQLVDIRRLIEDPFVLFSFFLGGFKLR